MKKRPRTDRRPLAWAIFLTVLCVLASPAFVQDDLASLEEQAVKAAVAHVAPSVLRIETIGGLERVDRVLVGTGATTGLAVSPDGYVISSAFNFIQKPAAILVTLPSGRRAPAEIVARDRSRMLVLLRVATDEPLAVPEAVPRAQMAVGQWTVAVGRTFEQDEPNVSVGILSATSRIWGKAIQTDAKVSPNNYGGPLIDIRGRVLGVLVPLSPQQQDEVAGAEWYDSGIGFAIPLADVLPYLDRLKQGQELHPGLMGITLKGNDIYADRAEIAACQPKSPARQAGLQAGDVIVELDGAGIVRQSQLRHALGPRYAGDRVQLAVMRGEQRVELTVELAAKLEPYENPFLGLLPDRTPAERPGVTVRYVYPGSPAAEAGVAAQDRLVRLADRPVTDVASAWEILGNYEPRQQVRLALERGTEAKEIELVLAALPTAVPEKLPAARKPVEPAAAEQRPPVGEVSIKLPEEVNECLAYVPEDYHPEVAYGIVLWLHEPGGFERGKLLDAWRDHCRAHDLILLAPQAADPKRWLPTEVDFIRKTLDEVISRYRIDRTRIVACGHQAGGAMAVLTAFAHRSLVRGVAVTDTALPGRLQIPPNDPLERLALLITVAEESEAVQRVQEQVASLQQMRYSIILRKHPGKPRPSNDAERAELVRWIDTLDRL